MLKPSFFIFVCSIVVLAMCCYYLFIKKEAMTKWAIAMKFTFYTGLIVSGIVFLWGIAYIIVAHII
jgi:hypothetical protein